MRVIGTAGHVDHGKSTLVQALTGIHPDRLKEEQEREMTIDLGFAWLTLPDGEEVGIVDVPGHRDFIENMLAGVGSIDATLFVIAADEGLMPQTYEHLAILDLLGIQAGVIALTKVDLVSEPEWLNLVEEEIHQAVQGTVMARAPILRVSARTGEGIPGLLAALTNCLENQPKRVDFGRPRLPVDRVFTIAGFGTVVTGTLSDGTLAAGEEVVILPGGRKGRIRGLQTHKKKTDIAVPGSRTAINIAGLANDELQRGDTVAHPGDYQPTQRLDVRFRILSDASGPLKHNTEAKFFIGASEVMCRIRLLGTESLSPGEEGWLQLELREPVVCVRGDRYILRRPSPGETIGGGEIVDPYPGKRHKRFSADLIQRLQALTIGDPVDIFEQALLTAGIAPLKLIFEQSNLTQAEADQAAHALMDSGRLILLENANKMDGPEISPTKDVLVTSDIYWEKISRQAQEQVAHFHQEKPLRIGMPREELKSKLRLSQRAFNAVLMKMNEAGTLIVEKETLHLPEHRVRYSIAQQKQINQLLGEFKASPYTPPSVKECEKIVGEDVFSALLEEGSLIRVAPDVVFKSEDYEHIRQQVVNALHNQPTLTVAEVRDLLHTSRKYALAVLEYFDAIGVTIRKGDYRKLNPQAELN